ncbi:hypothetical protein DAEQUDRAFT_99137 [Daedalea quercina L-15889]|uniref:Uncharacterized protein n=1 Tax=Daedalea quercina L-15889 TaxID=1314783 RepID=A0A165SDG5_9APHY|nr:hypothetical protein DAEQUDRAFT_99137 [Daedalea quercina L-15889]
MLSNVSHVTRTIRQAYRPSPLAQSFLGLHNPGHVGRSRRGQVGFSYCSAHFCPATRRGEESRAHPPHQAITYNPVVVLDSEADGAVHMTCLTSVNAVFATGYPRDFTMLFAGGWGEDRRGLTFRGRLSNFLAGIVQRFWGRRCHGRRPWSQHRDRAVIPRCAHIDFPASRAVGSGSLRTVAGSSSGASCLCRAPSAAA